jgi:hypothetical protein
MNYIELEEKLRKRIKKRRIIEAALIVAFLIIVIVFSVLYEQSKVVEEISFGPIKYQDITYNNDFTWGILVGALGFIPTVIYLICDFIFSKLVTFEVGNDYITFYRGIAHINLYVNGEYKDGLSLYGYYLEAALSDNTRVNVALGKWSAHFTFTNGHPPIDV